MKLTFRSKFNHGYLQSVVWKSLYDFKPIDDGSFFRCCSWIEGIKKAALPKICLIYPTMMTLGSYTLPKKIQKYINHATHHLSSTGIRKFCYTKKYIIQIAFKHIIAISFNFFWAFKGFIDKRGWNFDQVNKTVDILI